MNISSKHMATALVALLAAIPVIAGSKRSSQDMTADQRKAEYVFVEAQNQKSQGNTGAFYDLVKYAHDLDPENTAIGYYLGYCLVTMDNPTKSKAERGLALMKAHVDAVPTDFYEASFYSDASMAMGRKDEALRVVKRLVELDPTSLESQIRLAECYQRMNNFRMAIATYDTIERHQGKTIELTARKISAYSALNDTVGALRETRSLLNSAPNNATYNMALSKMMLQFGMNDSAFHYIDQAQKLDPDNGMIYLTKAQYYNMLGDSASYDREVYKALIAPNLDVESKIDVLATYTSTLLQRQDTTPRVERLFKVLLRQHPHEGTIHDLYSEYLVARNDYTGAAEQLGYLLDIDPTDAKGWRKLMIVNMMGENYPAAIKAAQRALEYNPDSINLYKYIAPAYFQMKEYDKALQTYNEALHRVDTTQASLRSDLIGGKGDVYFEMGDTARAFAAYERALKVYPGNASILNNYAYFLAECDSALDKAESMAGKAVNANPDNATFLDTYAWIFYKKHDYSMALFYIKSAVDNDDTGSADVLDHYGDILWFNDKHDEAVKQWAAALEKDPDNALIKEKVEKKEWIGRPTK